MFSTFSVTLISGIDNIINSPVLDNCAVLEIRNIFPEHLEIGELKLPSKDHFHFLVKDSSGWSLYQNAGRTLTEQELGILVNRLHEQKWLEQPRSNGQMLAISVSAYLQDFMDRLAETPGARVNPNVLQKGGSIYVAIEFDESCRKKTSDLLLDYAGDPDHNERSIVYFGKQKTGLSRLLSLYDNNGNTSESFILIQTIWKYTPEITASQVSGVFQNHGVFAPKFFSEKGDITMIARLEDGEIKGNVKSVEIGSEKNMYEIVFESHFLNDFYENVIMNYSGPIFYRIVTDAEKMRSFYIVDSRIRDKFIQSLTRYWNLPPRKDHDNSIELIDTYEFH